MSADIYVFCCNSCGNAIIRSDLTEGLLYQEPLTCERCSRSGAERCAGDAGVLAHQGDVDSNT